MRFHTCKGEMTIRCERDSYHVSCSLENNQIKVTVQLKCLHGSHYLISLMSLHSFFKYLVNTKVSSIIVWSRFIQDPSLMIPGHHFIIMKSYQ